MVKTLVVLATVFVMLFSMSGCVEDTDGKYKGLSIGFNYEHPNSMYETVGAVRSDETEFNVDNVILDFYFGWQKKVPNIVKPSEDNFDGYTIGFAIYIMDAETLFKTDEQGNHYRNEEAMFFLMEIPACEFMSEDYKVTITKRDGKQFQKSASLVIPKEAFTTLGGVLWFDIATIWYSFENGKIHRYDGLREYIRIKYEYVTENTVRLSK